jgi:signal peptidase I
MAERDRKQPEKERQRRRDGDSLREAAAETHHGRGVLVHLREWLDALVFAFVLAMFIRTFVVELFKIPSGSMSPTLLGDFVAEGAANDPNGQSGWYLLIRDRGSDTVQVFHKDARSHYEYEGRQSIMALTNSQRELLNSNLHLEEHRIFVNKFAYWFSKPDRGDIIVFRVPFTREGSVYERNGRAFKVEPYSRSRGVYVKRLVGFGGEQVEIGEDGRLVVDGKVVREPGVFEQRRYNTTDLTPVYSVRVPPGEVVMFGDNTDNSQDSRYWGGVPYENLRGKAFFRYWPARKRTFLNSD